ncbi:hypothetical protein BJP40_26520 [Streptomyces sp. CC53]|uniref:hypothetical protein n=1 Tax=unclassified Streptomyces TaxID=2593676 RepID=UPI0008DC7378|nr:MULTISPECIES: hypothetical protein [unclassified Streptomyces]OII62946.1 hypothetical protein BJP40_26520 [Streptomyces sp. CC53]
MHMPLELDKEARDCVDRLKIVLGSHGITLPSLGRDFGTPPLVMLGTATSRRPAPCWRCSR